MTEFNKNANLGLGNVGNLKSNLKDPKSPSLRKKNVRFAEGH